MTTWICVTGMHRSGTSLLSRVVNLLGIDLGEESAHIPAAEDNPKGFWENVPLVLFADELLGLLGGSWDAPPPLPDGWWEQAQLEEPRRLARQLLDVQFSGAEVAGWKDPRSSLLLPFWMTAVPLAKVVVAIRQPDEVVQSLRTRNEIDAESAAGLWLRYTLDAIGYADDPLLVHYDHLLADPVGVATALAAELPVPAPGHATLESIEAFADPALNRSTTPLQYAGPRLQLARTVHRCLRDFEPDEIQALVPALRQGAFPSAARGHDDQVLAALGIARQAIDEAAVAIGGRPAELQSAAEVPDSPQLELPPRLDAARPDVSCRTAVAETCLIHANAPPSMVPDDYQDVLLEATEALAGSGSALVFAWPEEAGVADPGWVTQVEQAGGVVLGPVAGRPDRLSTSVSAAAAGLAPRLVVQLGAAAHDDQTLALTVPASHSTLLVANPEHTLGDAAGRFTGVCAPDRLVTEIRTRMNLTRPTREQAIGSVSRESTAGRTSIVIPAWNGVDLTVSCLKAIDETTLDHDVEVVVVDNGSFDDTAERATELGARVLRNERNQGFAAACNWGMAESTGEFIVVLNNDTIPTAGWLEALLRPLQADKGIGLVGARSNSVSGHQMVPGAPSLDDLAAAKAWAAAWREDVGPAHWLTERVVAFAVAGRRRDFAQVGAFDAALGIGNYEDDELCDRFRAAGKLLAIADDAVVLHHGSATFQMSGLDYLAMLASGAARFGRRQRTPPALATGFVLSDGQPDPARRSAVSLTSICDEVVVLERGRLRPTELRLGVHLIPLRAVACDWSDPTPARAAVAAVQSRHAVVVRAGEELQLERDWGRLRHALATQTEPLGLASSLGDEIRVIQPTTDLDVLGSSAGTTLDGCRLTIGGSS